MRTVRRFAIGCLLIAVLSLSTLSNFPKALATADVDTVDDSIDGVAEAVIDSVGDVLVDAQEIKDEDASDVAETETEPVSIEEAVDVAVTETPDVVDDEVSVSEKSTAFVSNVRAKAAAFADKAKEITPEHMKKVAVGALGIWGVAAGAGWVMNNLGGGDD